MCDQSTIYWVAIISIDNLALNGNDWGRRKMHAMETVKLVLVMTIYWVAITLLTSL